MDTGTSGIQLQQGEAALSYEEKKKFATVIAKPMASEKLAKRLYKLIRKASKQKTFLRKGLKGVQAKIRKGERGLVVLAGDVMPMDIMTHLPGLCEEHTIAYIYTPSRLDIGLSVGMRRSCLAVMIREHPEYMRLFSKCMEEVKNSMVSIWTSG